MTRDILSLDVGTTAFKLGVFNSDLRQACEASRKYDVNVYDHGKADIEPEKWWQALRECCAEVKQHLRQVGVVTMSVTTPGLTPMAADGSGIRPGNSLLRRPRLTRRRATIRAVVGEERFLRDDLQPAGHWRLVALLHALDPR